MILLRFSRLTAAFVLLAASLPAVQRDQPPPPVQDPAPDAAPEHVEPKQMFFAGQVTALDPDHITVSRTLVGKAPETRTFSIDKKTKVSKSVHVKSRVTVRFRHDTTEDVALEVQVHPPGHPAHSSG
jgi:hypothetical protein